MVTVVIPAFRRPDLVEQALASVVAQTFPHWECVVVDSGFADRTESVVAGFRDSRIRTTHNHPPGVVAVARNRGAAEGAGEFLAFLDQDDIWVPDWLERAMVAMKASGVELVYGFLLPWYTAPDGIQETLATRWRTWNESRKCLPPGFSGSVVEHLLDDNFISSSGCFLARSLFDRAGGFPEDPNAFGVDDYEFWLRCACLSEFAAESRPAGRQRRHDGQATYGIDLRVREEAARVRFTKWRKAREAAV